MKLVLTYAVTVHRHVTCTSESLMTMVIVVTDVSLDGTSIQVDF